MSAVLYRNVRLLGEPSGRPLDALFEDDRLTAFGQHLATPARLIRNSLISSCVFSAFGVLLSFATVATFTHLYEQIDLRSVVFFIALSPYSSESPYWSQHFKNR